MYLIYGFPIDEAIDSELDSLADDPYSSWSLEHDEECGFTILSSFYKKRQGWVGIILAQYTKNSEFPVSQLNVKPSEAQIFLVKQKIDKLLPSLKSLVLDPGVFVII